MAVAAVALILGAVALAHMAPFPFLFEAFRPARSLWRVPPAPGAPPTIYLTFDDGPNPDWTPPLLDALRDAGIQATFFLIDDYVTSETSPIVRRMAEDGHAIGLHSGTRRLMVLSPDVLAARLHQAADRITAIAGREPCRLFRPHAGWRSDDDVSRARSRRVSPRRVELGDVGLALVAEAACGPGGAEARA